LVQRAVLAVALGLTSCQPLADIETRAADPWPAGCVLPAATSGDGNAEVRLAHLVPVNDKIDVCVRPSGSSSYGRPILRNAGAGAKSVCERGLAYSEVTIPFRITSGKSDVKIIPAGTTCAAPALVESTGVEVGTEVVVTLAYIGAPDTGATLIALPELPQAGAVQARKVRLVNAIAGAFLDFGFTPSDRLPAALQTGFLSTPVGFGEVPALGTAVPGFEIEDGGYVATPSAQRNVVAAHRGTSKAILLAPIEGAGDVTLFAVGKAGSVFPVRGLVCRDREQSDEAPALARCDLTEMEDFRIDVFNAALHGAFAALEDLRAPLVIKDLAERGTTSDLLCVTEVSRHAGLDVPANQNAWTQEQLIAAAKAVPGGFQYVAQAKTDLDSVIDDPSDQQGRVPVLPARAPCDDAADPAVIKTVYECLIANCNTEPGSDRGVSEGGADCYTHRCGASALAALLFGDENQRQCFNCVILNALSYLSWSKSKERCTTDTRWPYAFDGRPTSMLLSRAPLVDVDQYVVQSSAFRRVAIYARMQYEGDRDIDVYCIHAPPLLGANMPYTGPYGNGASFSSGAAWQQEQTWATQKIIAWIQRKSSGRPAIIIGDWAASAVVLDGAGNVTMGPDGMPAVADVNAETIQRLGEAFLPAVPATFVPQCTRCPASGSGGRRNPYVTGVTAPMWTLRVFIKDPWGGNPTRSAGLFYDQLDRVSFPRSTEFGLFGPLSETFGFTVSIHRP
jgi:hypothetical protein